MAEFHDPDALAVEVRHLTVGQEAPLVAIDGAYGSGKTTLARYLAASLGGAVIEVDRFTEGNGLPFRQQLDYDAIRHELEVFRGQHRPIVVDGVCILHVLRQTGTSVDVLIYVKRVDETGLWLDEDECDPELIDLDSPMLRIRGSELAREIASYHLEYNPLPRADIVLLRIDRPDIL